MDQYSAHERALQGLVSMYRRKAEALEEEVGKLNEALTQSTAEIAAARAHIEQMNNALFARLDNAFVPAEVVELSKFARLGCEVADALDAEAGAISEAEIAELLEQFSEAADRVRNWDASPGDLN